MQAKLRMSEGVAAKRNGALKEERDASIEYHYATKQSTPVI